MNESKKKIENKIAQYNTSKSIIRFKRIPRFDKIYFIIYNFNFLSIMAFMGFDRDTLIDLMSIVDDNKTNINEAKYVKMCNALRALNQMLLDQQQKSSRRTAPPPNPNPSPPSPPPPLPEPIPEAQRLPVRDGLFDTGVRRNGLILRRPYIPDTNLSPGSLEHSILVLEGEVKLAAVEANNNKRRILNSHRQLVIEELTQQKFEKPNGGTKSLKSIEIQQHVDDMITNGLIVDMNDFKQKSIEKAAELAMSYLERKQKKLDIQKLKLNDEINRRNRSAACNPDNWHVN